MSTRPPRSVEFNDESWEYWVRLDSWSNLEAAFILDGIIPSDSTMRDYGFHIEGMGVSIEPDTETILNMLKRKFSAGKASPTLILEWAQNQGIALSVDLIAAAHRRKIIKSKTRVSSSEDDEDARGKHWLEKHIKILSLALSLIDDPPPDHKTPFKKNGKLHLQNLAELVKDFEHIVGFQASDGFSEETIRDKLAAAIGVRKSSD